MFCFHLSCRGELSEDLVDLEAVVVRVLQSFEGSLSSCCFQGTCTWGLPVWPRELEKYGRLVKLRHWLSVMRLMKAFPLSVPPHRFSISNKGNSSKVSSAICLACLVTVCSCSCSLRRWLDEVPFHDAIGPEAGDHEVLKIFLMVKQTHRCRR